MSKQVSIPAHVRGRLTSEISATPEVCLTLQNKNWTVQFRDHSNRPEGTTFAFYLVRNGTRVAHRWYQECPAATFENDGIAGRYRVMVFVKQTNPQDGSSTTQTFDSETITQDGAPYDLRQWNHVPLFERNITDLWGASEPLNGLYHFKKGDGHVDFLLTGMEKIGASKAILVCFSGAVSSRSGMSAPFFAGVGVAKQLDVPVISVADPSLSSSHEIGLGWYSGHDGFADLPHYISKLLDSFAERTGSRLVLFGGSGGGFASMLTLGLLKTANASAFVWNPQTSISRYNSIFVECYLKTAFPNQSFSNGLEDALESTGVIHDLTTFTPLLNSRHQILYIQNKSDWHTRTHAKPFLAKFPSRQAKSEEVISCNENLAYWEGSWGEGHAPPPKQIIVAALGHLLSGTPPLTVALTLSEDYAGSSEVSTAAVTAENSTAANQ